MRAGRASVWCEQTWLQSIKPDYTRASEQSAVSLRCAACAPRDAERCGQKPLHRRRLAHVGKVEYDRFRAAEAARAPIRAHATVGRSTLQCHDSRAVRYRLECGPNGWTRAVRMCGAHVGWVEYDRFEPPKLHGHLLDSGVKHATVPGQSRRAIPS